MFKSDAEDQHKGMGVADPAVKTPRYAAFISYSRADARTAAWLHRSIEAYVIPRRLRGRQTPVGLLGRRLPPVFRDREEFAAAGTLADAVRDALMKSSALIVVCSPEAVQSRWVNQEIREFAALGKRPRVQCMITAGVPNSSTTIGGDPTLECLPSALFDGDGGEPMAADIRPGMDGRAAAKLKLIAGLLEIDYDELRQREQHRRYVRLAVAASVLATALIVVAGLALAALLARDDAIRQRDVATQKTLTAERTVDFVKSIFAVADPSESRGETITAREILDRGEKRIRTSMASEPVVKAELSTTLGEVYAGLGLFRRGEKLIRDASALQHLPAETRARQHAALGEALTRQGEYSQARAQFSAGLAIAERAEVDRADLKSRLLVGLADATSAGDDFVSADRYAGQALTIDQNRPGETSPDIARDLEALALSAFLSERYGRARSLLDRALAIRRSAQGAFHPKVSEDINMLGATAYLLRDSASAEKYYREALAVDMRVLGPDHPDVAITMNNLARILLERRDFVGARSLLIKAVAIMLRERPATQDDMAFLFANLGMAERGLGQPASARALLDKALRAAELHRHRNRGPILVESADLDCEAGKADSGIASLNRADPLVQTDYPDETWRRAWLNVVRARCLAAAGRTTEAIPLLRGSSHAVRVRWSENSLYGARLEAIERLIR